MQNELERSGFIRFADVMVNASDFYIFVEENKLERVSKGIYAKPDAWLDEMLLLSMRAKKAIFSHESALLLHDLTDREPKFLTVTVPSGYNRTNLKEIGTNVFSIKPTMLELGKTSMLTPDGNSVPCYDLERTICDVIRSRSKIEKQTFIGALQGYARRPDKRISTLQEYAQQLGISTLIPRYLEVLL